MIYVHRKKDIICIICSAWWTTE